MSEMGKQGQRKSHCELSEYKGFQLKFHSHFAGQKYDFFRFKKVKTVPINPINESHFLEF